MCPILISRINSSYPIPPPRHLLPLKIIYLHNLTVSRSKDIQTLNVPKRRNEIEETEETYKRKIVWGMLLL